MRISQSQASRLLSSALTKLRIGARPRMGHGTVSLSVSAARPRLETVDAADAPHEATGLPQKEGRSERSTTTAAGCCCACRRRLHAALAHASETEHISLNQFINDALEKAIDPRALQDSRDAKTEARETERSEEGRIPHGQPTPRCEPDRRGGGRDTRSRTLGADASLVHARQRNERRPRLPRGSRPPTGETALVSTDGSNSRKVPYGNHASAVLRRRTFSVQLAYRTLRTVGDRFGRIVVCQVHPPPLRRFVPRAGAFDAPVAACLHRSHAFAGMEAFCARLSKQLSGSGAGDWCSVPPAVGGSDSCVMRPSFVALPTLPRRSSCV